MKAIPIIRVTEMLAQRYALWARSVVHCPPVHADTGCMYQVESTDGRQWCLQVSDEAFARNDVLGSLLMREPHPSLRGEPSVCHRDQYWTLFALAQGESRRVPAAGPWPSAGLGLAASPPRLRAADTRVLDRVGGWIAQPAGLPTATDPLGGAFVQQWQQALAHVKPWHAYAESLHDALQAEMQALGCGADDPRWLQWEQCCLLLHALQELQLLLLGPRARFQPQAIREQGVQRLAVLLPQLRVAPARSGEAEQAAAPLASLARC